MKSMLFGKPAAKHIFKGICPAAAIAALGFVFLGVSADLQAAVTWGDPGYSLEFTYFTEIGLYDEASWAALTDAEQKKALTEVRPKAEAKASAHSKKIETTGTEGSEEAVSESVKRLDSAVSGGGLDTFSGGSQFFDGLLQVSGGALGVQSGVNDYSVPEPGPPARAKTDPAKGKYSSLKRVVPPKPGPKQIWKAGEDIKKKLDKFVNNLNLKVGGKIDVVLNYHSTRMKTDCGEPMTIQKVGKDKYYIHYLDKNGKVGVYGNSWLHKTVTAEYLKQNFRENILGFVEKYKKYVGDGSTMLSITIEDFNNNPAEYYRGLDDSRWPWVRGKKPA